MNDTKRIYRGGWTHFLGSTVAFATLTASETWLRHAESNDQSSAQFRRTETGMHFDKIYQVTIDTPQVVKADLILRSVYGVLFSQSLVFRSAGILRDHTSSSRGYGSSFTQSWIVDISRTSFLRVR
ncbi:protein of unknown function [Nitrospira japonica]|uniref:Uncharacterized protein n=1 Tax=Nitrospira japonica TaxID=1325564 RepID=A0A1W1I342_9BACT|nr:protein of unknown function [Nitrospira japonica]